MPDLNNDDLSLAHRLLHYFSQPHSKFLIKEEIVTLNGTNHPQWFIQTAMDLSSQHTLISEYCDDLILALLIGGLLAIFVGYLITRQGLKCLDNLTAATKTITANSSNQRIDPELWPEELRTVGLAYNEMLDRIEHSFSQIMQFSSDLAHEL